MNWINQWIDRWGKLNIWRKVTLHKQRTQSSEWFKWVLISGQAIFWYFLLVCPPPPPRHQWSLSSELSSPCFVLSSTLLGSSELYSSSDSGSVSEQLFPSCPWPNTEPWGIGTCLKCRLQSVRILAREKFPKVNTSKMTYYVGAEQSVIYKQFEVTSKSAYVCPPLLAWYHLHPPHEVALHLKLVMDRSTLWGDWHNSGWPLGSEGGVWVQQDVLWRLRLTLVWCSGERPAHPLGLDWNC